MSDPVGRSRSNEIVYCHECRNEWYRGEHGLTCPECHSDFVEIVEPQHDPRQDNPSSDGYRQYGYEIADDPEEGDIDDVYRQQEQPAHHWNYYGDGERRSEANEAHSSERAGPSGGLFGLIGSVLPSLLRAGHSYPATHQSPHESAEEANRQQSRGESVINDLRDRSYDGQPDEQGPRIRQYRGPGYNVTITTSSNSNLFPRDASNPQPFEHQPHNLEQMMHQILSNIGVTHSVQTGRSPNDPRNHNFGEAPPGFPFGNIFQLVGLPFGLADSQGDAVFSQEALDRVITELMEQNQSGNAPGPASANAIAALPERRIESKDLDEKGNAGCSICMDPVDLQTTVTELPCHHWFHSDCIKSWLVEHDTCPHCRQSITPKPDSNSQAR